MVTRKMPSLSIGSSHPSTQHRKYLGDTHDPHFVPKSPLISRQKLSIDDEEELKYSCRLALANVPHSDEMTDDPFRYLASHINVRQPGQTRKAEQHSGTRDKKRELSAPLTAISTAASAGDETTTPSETSRRETIRTATSTPLTTPEVTPGETGKRFSDAGKRPVTAQPSQLRTEVKTFKGSTVYSFLESVPVAVRPRTASASKSMTHLPTLTKHKSKSKRADTQEQNNGLSLGRPDFNKSLPALPKLKTNEETTFEDAKQQKPRSGISRILKTVRLQRTQPPVVVVPRSTSTDLSRAQEVLEQSAAIKKHKSIFSVFQRRGVSQTKRATVG